MNVSIRDLVGRVVPSERNGFPVMKGYVPAVGHLPVLHFRALEALRRAAREQGPLVQVSLGFGQWYLFFLGADMFELLRHRSVAVAGARARLDYIIGHSLLTTDGAYHRHIRSAMNPTFSARGLTESTAARVTLEIVRRHARASPTT